MEDVCLAMFDIHSEHGKSATLYHVMQDVFLAMFDIHPEHVKAATPYYVVSIFQGKSNFDAVLLYHSKTTRRN